MSIEELEKLRKKALEGYKKRRIVTILYFIFFAVAFFGFVNLQISAIGILLLFPLTAFYILYSKHLKKEHENGPIRDYVLAYKMEFVKKSFSNIFEDIVYNPEKGIDESVLKNTGLVDTAERYSSNDFISGKYKSLSFWYSDIHTEILEKSNDSRRWETVFRGKWLIFDFNKDFKSNTVLTDNVNYVSVSSKARRYEKVFVEDQEFNNKFIIFTENSHEAFYILTPAFIERIKRLSNNIDGYLLCCFTGNKLHIGINKKYNRSNNKDSFEPNIYEKIDSEKVIFNIKKDIELITDFVDELDLANNLFKGVDKR